MKNLEYTKGSHYNHYLTVNNDYNAQGTRVTKVINKRSHYLFHMFNNYITLYSGKLVINSNGTAKAVIRVNKNYSSPYQYTLYFDKEGYEIKCEHNNTRKELMIYKELDKV